MLIKSIAFALLITSLAFGITDQDRVRRNLVDGPTLLGDSGINYRPYNDLEADMDALEQKYPQQVKVITYGKTVKERNLKLLRIEKRNRLASFAERSAIEISGAIHGNEFLGIEDKLAPYFLEHQDDMPGLASYLNKGGVIYVVPVVNPDGYESRQRGNSHNEDLNRDFDVLPIHSLKFREPESTQLAKYLDTDMATNHLQLKLSLDYHCCVPALITPWTYTDEHPLSADQARFKEIADIQTKYLGYKIGNAQETVGYLAVGTTTDYFYAKYGTLGLTLEGKHGGEEKVFAKHVAMWSAIFEQQDRH